MTTTVTFHVGDVRDVMAAMPDNHVDLLVTSPPFLALRSYLPADHPDKHREIGSETTPAAFLDTLLGLTADWRRVVADWGSIAVEIGDTYSGNIPPFGATADTYSQRARGAEPMPRSGPGWPLAKSLCGIPTLYTWSLAYGRNLLTGQPSPAGQWRIRNLLVWTRPNPPVGALGDKYRPATSYVTVATVDQKRWFDLDAVRERNDRTNEQPHVTAKHEAGNESTPVKPFSRNPAGTPLSQNPAGAPPLDWWDGNDNPDPPPNVSYVTVATVDGKRWFDLDAVRTEHAAISVARTECDAPRRMTSRANASAVAGGDQGEPRPHTLNPAGAPPLDWWDGNDNPDWQPLHRLPTQPYKGSHYAAFPVALPRRLIESMCPREVCTVCGEGRRRVVESESFANGKPRTENMNGRSSIEPWRADNDNRKATGATFTRTATTLGWTDCECFAGLENNFIQSPKPHYRPGRVLDPFGGSGTTAVAAALCGRDAVLIDIDRRNVDLTRQRLSETVRILTETWDGDTVTWTVEPATAAELAADKAGQLSIFDEEHTA